MSQNLTHVLIRVAQITADTHWLVILNAQINSATPITNQKLGHVWPNLQGF